MRTEVRSYGDTYSIAELALEPCRVVAVKRLRRSFAALRSLRDDCVGATRRFAIKPFDARSRPRAAGLRRRRP
jgi:hypothetical protein